MSVSTMCHLPCFCFYTFVQVVGEKNSKWKREGQCTHAPSQVVHPLASSRSLWNDVYRRLPSRPGNTEPKPELADHPARHESMQQNRESQ